MKNKTLSLLLFLLIVCGTVAAQELPEEVNRTFKKGEASLIEDYLGNRVQYIYASLTQHLTKEETVKALDRFFTDNPPNGFSVLHRSKKENSGFVVGKLFSSKGAYRIHILFKDDNNRFSISQIRIDEFNE